MVFSWLDKQADKLWDKVDPPVKTTLKPEYRDKTKAASRRGPKGTGLTRRERARNMDDDGLRSKLDSSQRKMSENLGGTGRNLVQAGVTTKALHWHLTPGAVIRTGTNGLKTVKQLPRYNDYEKEYLARGSRHERPEGSNRRDMWNGALGRHSTAKRVEGPAKGADALQNLHDASQSRSDYVSYDSAPHYTYPNGHGGWIQDLNS